MIVQSLPKHLKPAYAGFAVLMISQAGFIGFFLCTFQLVSLYQSVLLLGQAGKPS